MKIGVFLNFIGLGSNLLHLSYCHQIAKKYGPISIITPCKNLKEALDEDPQIKEILVFDKNNLSRSLRLPISTGISPESSLSCKYKKSNLCKFPISAGISPESLLFDKSMLYKLVS